MNKPEEDSEEQRDFFTWYKKPCKKCSKRETCGHKHIARGLCLNYELVN